MNTLDLGVALLVVAGAAWGAFAGALRQLVPLVAWAAALAAPWFLAGPVARLLEAPLGTSFPVAFAFAAASLALLAYVCVRVACAMLRNALYRGAEQNESAAASVVAMGDRVAGTLLGTAKAAAIAWVMLSVVALVAARLDALRPPALARSAFLQGAGRHNAVALLFADRLRTVERALGRLEAGDKRAASPPLAELQGDARLRALARDPKLRAALARGDMQALAASPALLSLVSDTEVMHRMARLVAAHDSAVSDLK